MTSDRIDSRIEEAERERDALKEAWLKVCHEGNVPQYETATVASPEAILHGVRQLASLWGGERELRKIAERERDDAREEASALYKQFLADHGSAYAKGTIEKLTVRAESAERDRDRLLSLVRDIRGFVSVNFARGDCSPLAKKLNDAIADIEKAGDK